MEIPKNFLFFSDHKLILFGCKDLDINFIMTEFDNKIEKLEKRLVNVFDKYAKIIKVSFF